MDDTISRKAAIDIERNATVDTNPSHFEAHQKFAQFLSDAEVSSFGRWQWANGFNTALTAVGIDLKKLPSAEPERKVFREMSDTEFEKWLHEHGICNPDIHESIPCDAIPSLIDFAINELPSAESEVKPISYIGCANAMLKMWIDEVLTDSEYNRIMDKLNAKQRQKGKSNE